MAQICTTIEQSKRLCELGISNETADMSWHSTGIRSKALEYELKTNRLMAKENLLDRIGKLVSLHYKHPDGTPMTGEEVFDKIWGKDIPAWSLGALIKLLPDKIKEDRFGINYYLTIDKDGIKYSNRMEDEENEYECYGELIDSCVDMIDTLVAEGCIKV